VEEKKTPAKGQLEEPLASHYQDAGRLPAALAERPRSQSGCHSLKVYVGILRLDCKWRGENGGAFVTKEGSLKLLINITKNILLTFHIFVFLYATADSSLKNFFCQ